MSAPTRFPSGLNCATNDKKHPLYNFKSPIIDRSLVINQSDFTEYRAVDWTSTVVGTGAAAITSGVGGILSVVTSAASGDSVEIQHNSGDLSFTANQQAWWECRISCSSVTDTDVVAGVQIVNTAPLTATDGVYFVKPTGAATVNLVAKAALASTTTVNAIDTMVNSTYAKYALYYDGKSTITYYVNNVAVGSIATTNVPGSSVILSPVFFIKTNSTNARTLLVDYYLAATEISR